MITKMNHKLAVRVVSFYFPLLSFLFLFAACTVGGEQEVTTGFVTIDGHNLIKPNGEKLLIQGTNLGNWLNPEGYMFGFGRTNSALITPQSSGSSSKITISPVLISTSLPRRVPTLSVCPSTINSSPMRTIWVRQDRRTVMCASTPS